MTNKKGINKILLAVMALAVYALASFLFYIFLESEEKKEPKKAVSLIDSLAIKYELNLDSLREDKEFISELMKKVPEDEIYDRMLSYTDEYVIQQLENDTLTSANDSLRTIIAKKELKEEYLLEFIQNNKEKYQLMLEKKKLYQEVGALEEQLDTIARKSERVISDNITNKKELEVLSEENKKLKQEPDKKQNTENIKKLVKKYESMKPLKAAKILYRMPDNEVVKILRGMKNRQAAKILTALPAQKASKLSLLLMKEK